MPKTLPKPLTLQQFEDLFRELSNAGRWGAGDERGTLNYITPDHIRRAASLVRAGRAVSMAIPINKVAGPENPNPPSHYFMMHHDVPIAHGEPRFAMDFFGSQIHGDCHTHIDALCHCSYQGKLYNGKPATSVTSQGPEIQDITVLAQGVLGRGVLLDLPRLRGVKWLEPGEAVTAGELVAAEKAQGVRLEEGDIFHFRTGHHRRRLELGPWDNSYAGEGKAGLHATALRLLHERKVAAFFPDGDGETVPSGIKEIPYPIHAIQLAAMGMTCADSLQFEELAPVCESLQRWEFMVVAAPLRLPRGTGSLFNPLAIF